MSIIYKTFTIALILCIAPIAGFSQSSFNSPMSMYGIGDISNRGFSRSQAMGGVSSSLYSSFQLNPENPASYGAILPYSFIFEFGLKTNYDILKGPVEKSSKFTGNINYVAMGFPITKWWKTGAGLMPLSSIGYDINTIEEFDVSGHSMKQNYNGKGGINSLYFDNSFKILKSLSIGVKASYLFGTLDKKRTITNSEASFSATRTVDENNSTFDAISFGLGAIFSKNIKKININIGATYNLGHSLEGQNKRDITSSVTTYLTNNGVTQVYSLFSDDSKQKIFDLPSNYSVGASLFFNQKLLVGFDYKVENWSQTKFQNESFNQSFFDNEKICFGIEYTPDYFSTKYFNLVKYRLGFNKTNSYLMINDKQLKQIGASVGLGFPLKNGSNISISALYNKKNIDGSDLIKEDSFEFNLNLSLRATWFVKTKYY